MLHKIRFKSSAAEHWTQMGLPKEKIIIGFASYGRAWTLTNPNQTSVGSAGGLATAGHYTKEAGFLAYYEVINLEHFHFQSVADEKFVLFNNEVFKHKTDL